MTVFELMEDEKEEGGEEGREGGRWRKSQPKFSTAQFHRSEHTPHPIAVGLGHVVPRCCVRNKLRGLSKKKKEKKVTSNFPQQLKAPC